MKYERWISGAAAVFFFAMAVSDSRVFDGSARAAAVANADNLVQARDELARERARDAADAWLRALGEKASSLSEDASEAWLDADEHGPRGRKRSDTASWERLKTLLGAPRVPAGARVAVYEQPDGPGSPPLRLLGWADAQRVVRDGLDTWPGRIPEAVGRQELDVSTDELSPDDLGWFAREGAEVRFHVSALYSHSYEDEDGDSVVVMRAFDASVPLTAPESLRLDARCDLVDGAATPALPAFPIAGARPTGPKEVSTTAAAPGLHPWRLPTPDRRPRLDVYATPFHPPAPLPDGPDPWIVVALLVTGASMLVTAVRPARASSSAPPDVTAEAAHELKTPLTVMRGNLEVALRRERAPDEYRATLASTLEEVKGLQNVIGSVLLLTRGAETPMAREPVDLVALVKGEAERLNALATDREVSFASVRGPRTVVGDPSLLARAVGNLLDNAHLHSVAGGAIRVRLEVVGEVAIVSVEDDGPGIPPTRREKVFERFWRGPEVGQRGIPGAGLGLPISRWIAEAHGGSLTLDPSVEGRARFVLRLPLGTTGS